MDIAVIADPAARAAHAADLVEELLTGRAEPVLGVATGASPLELYAELERRRERMPRGLGAFALDEYVGIDPRDPRSYAGVVRDHVTVPLGLDPRRVHVPDGRAADLAAACRAYEEAIAASGGVDVQIVGIGTNGHIGFNEPGSSFDSRTRVVELAASTREANARYFDEPSEVPTHAVTQGIATILSARRIVLLAAGAAKAEAVAAALEGPVDPACPASALQRHPEVHLVLDPDAASQLRGVAASSVRG